VSKRRKWSRERIPIFPVSTVESHKGKFILGKLSGKKVVAMQDRFHYYEGYSMKEITLLITNIVERI
jgi:purine-nucleoside phosphorylase